MIRILQQGSFSLRSVLMLTVSILTLLIVLLSGRGLYGEWQKWEKLQSLKQVVLVSQQFFNSIEQLSREREITTALLYSPNKQVSSSLTPQLATSRQEADKSLDHILSDMKHISPKVDPATMQQFNQQRAQLIATRERADQMLALPFNARDPAIHQQWFDTSTQSIATTYNLWVGFTRNFTQIEPVITQRLMFQHFLGLIIRYAGREHALIGGLIIAERPITPREQSELLRWRGVVEQGWEMCARLSERSAMSPAITPYLRDAESHYLSVYEMVEDLFYIPGTAVRTYPITVDQWLDVAGGSNDSLNALKNAALQQTENYAAQLERSAERSMMMHALVLLLALSLCFYIFRFVDRRVIGPVQRMVDVLLDTAVGKPVQQLPITASQGDEIGKLAEVLFSLQKHMEGRGLLAAIVESSDDAIISKTLDGIITSWNRGAEHIFGYSAAEAVGKHISLIIPPERKDEEALIIGKIHHNENLEHLETVRRHKSGRPVDISLTVSPIRNAQGTIIGASKIARDISDRKESEEKIRRSESRLLAVANNILDGLITIDARGNVESFNPACERIFGYQAEEVIGHNIKMLMPEPYHSEHDGYLSHYHKTGEARIIGTAGREVSGRRKDGSVFPMDLSVSSFMLEDGMHFSGIVRDITTRKEAEENIRRYTSDLERSNKELDDFAYIASHDLKEPLRGIHNHSRFLLEDNADKLDEGSTGRLHRLLYLTQRMEKLVNDLLYFSRLGRQELAIQPADLNQVVKDIESLIDVFLGEHNARILIPKPLPTIICDKTRVTEVFRNLISNAVKYNKSPEKIIEIGRLDRHPAPGGEQRNVFYVKDNGVGIPLEFHEEVFRIFRRLQASNSPEDGTGVGLTFVKKIIERHGGRIWLESKPGEGTVFYFTLGSTSQ